MSARRRAVTAWWGGHIDDGPQEPGAIRVDSNVHLTGMNGSARMMRVTEIKAGSARCEWTYSGKRHADWFSVSGLRRST